jgi:hypothetical protein
VAGIIRLFIPLNTNRLSMSNTKEIFGTIISVISLGFGLIQVFQNCGSSGDVAPGISEEQKRKQKKKEQVAIDFEIAIKRIEAKERLDSLKKDSLAKAEAKKLDKPKSH